MPILVPDPKPTPVLIAFSVVGATSKEALYLMGLNDNPRNDK